MNNQKFTQIPIKTIDDSRPNHVHLHGTILFDEIRNIFGIHAIRALFQAWNKLKGKNTNQLIEQLNKEDYHELSAYLLARINGV